MVWLNLEPLPENGNLQLPKYANKFAAGVDFSACLTRLCKLVKEDGKKIGFYTDASGGRDGSTGNESSELHLSPNEIVMVSLGFKCEFNDGHVMQIHVRSSMGLRNLVLANGTGIIDSDYRGEMYACVFNRGKEKLVISHGQKIVQGVILPCYQAAIQESSVTDTERGDGGFGSTGK